MKFVFGLLLAAALLIETMSAASLSEIKTVYVFPMRNSLDQYLVSRLTQTHTLQVVSDPKLADAVFTDTVGPTFESTFNQQVLDGKVDTTQVAHAFRSSRNTVFLVSKSKRVIWSTYLAPKDSTRKQMEKASNRVGLSLQKALGMVPALPSSSSR